MMQAPGANPWYSGPIPEESKLSSFGQQNNWNVGEYGNGTAPIPVIVNMLVASYMENMHALRATGLYNESLALITPSQGPFLMNAESQAELSRSLLPQPLRGDLDNIFARPSIIVKPLTTLGFTQQPIEFAIEIYNFPGECKNIAKMIDCVIFTPSGVSIRCSLHDDGRTEGPFKKVLGVFRVRNEIGNYTFSARAAIPIQLVHQKLFDEGNCGIITHYASVLVTRDYLRDSEKGRSNYFRPEPFRRRGSDGERGGCPKAWGIAYDPHNDRLYYADTTTNIIGCLNSEGTILYKFCHSQPISKLKNPRGLAIDLHKRRLAVCDTGKNRVCFFSLGGKFLSFFGSHGYSNGYFKSPWGIAISPDGTRIAVTDSYNQRVQLFDEKGRFLNKFGPENEAIDSKRIVLEKPRGIAFDPDGKYIYLTDIHTAAIIRTNNDLTCPARLKTFKIVRPQGLVIDHIGNVLVADSESDAVHQVSSNGKVVCTIEFVGRSHLQRPVNVTIGINGTLLIVDGSGGVYHL